MELQQLQSQSQSKSQPQPQNGTDITQQQRVRPAVSAKSGSERSTSTLHEDPFSHLVPREDTPVLTYSDSQQRFYTITSYFCTALFLGVLFMFAFFHYLYGKARAHFVDNDTPPPPAREYLLPPEELRLDPDLNYYFRLYGLQVDTYDVITEDGFVLTVQRILDPRESREQRSKRRPLLCMHGLLQSSGSFCSSGKESLAYFLFRSGFDVWLGNNRCGFEPRHTFLSPDDYLMWEWDIVEMARYDLTTTINHVLSSIESGAQKLTLVAHSQGTTQGFIALDSDRFGLSSKINAFIALAPAVYGGPLLDSKVFINVISKMCGHHFFFGVHSFLPIMMKMRGMLLKTSLFSFFSYMMFSFLFDWNDRLWNKRLKGRHFLSSPVYISVRLMSWWLNDKAGFKKSRSILEHRKQWFDAETPPIFLVIPQKDRLVDGGMLVQHMSSFEPNAVWDYKVLEKYSHLDVLWSHNVIEDVGFAVLDFLQTHDQLES